MARSPSPAPRKPTNPIVGPTPPSNPVPPTPSPSVTLQSAVSADLSVSSLSGYSGLVLTGSNDIIGKGNSKPANYLAANNGNSTLVADTSLSTTLVAGSGNNYLDGRKTPVTGSLLIRGGVGNSTMLGGAGRATILGGTGNSSMIAGSGDQVLVGGSSNASRDTILGGAGKDTLKAGKGYSTLVSGSRTNGSNILVTDGISSSLVAGAGNDSLSAVLFGGNTTMVGGQGKTWLVGGKDSNSLVSGSSLATGSNTLIGGSGSNTLVAGVGKDLLKGGDTRNLLLFGQNNILDQSIYLSKKSTSTNVLGITSKSATSIQDSDLSGISNLSPGSTLNGIANYGSAPLSVVLGQNATALSVQSVTGGAASDTLSALYSRLGGLTLNGGAGADCLIGGQDGNYFVVDNPGDTVIAAPGGGQDTVKAFVDYSLPANAEVLVLAGRDSINGWGNSLDNTLIGNASQNSLFGGDGNDSIVGNNPNVLPDISFVGRNVSQTAQNYITSAENSLINGLGGRSGYGSNVVAPGDDNSSSAIDITSVFGANGLNFYGNQIKQIYINNNGNITFNSPASTFTPTSISAGAGIPIIAPFWADVDTRGATGNVSPGGTSDGANRVFWNIDSVNRVMTITWDDVGFFSQNDSKVNAFQLQLIDSGNGDGFIVFRYEAVNWTTGSASGGTNGLGGNVARAGFNTGTGTVIELPQSGNQAAMLGLPQTTPTVGLNSNSPGVFVFEVKNGRLNVDVAGDYLSGGSGSDTIQGAAGNDTIDGGTGADSMIGGAGDDIYYVDNVGDTILEKAGEGTDIVFSTASHTLGANVENLTYTGIGSATLVGNDLANTIIGNDQGNRIDGGAGIDSLVGGLGNDTYVVDNLADVIVENAGGGIDLVESSINYTLGGNLEQLALVGAAISGTGNTLANTIIGNSLGNSIDGGLGADSMAGGAGNDTYFVDNAGDTIFENVLGGTDLVLSSVSYTLNDNVENLTYTGTSGASLGGNASANVIDGSAAGINTISGGAGNDTLVVNASRIGTVDGGDGADTVSLLGGSATLNNAALSNVEIYDLSQLTGQAAVTLGNNSGALTSLVGTAGNDTITAFSAINATLDAAAGNDRFVFAQASLIGAVASIVGGSGADTLSFANTSSLSDSLFGNVSSVEFLEQNGTGNYASLGASAQAAGIRTAITGTGNDTLDASAFTTGITLDASRNTGSGGAGTTVTGGSGDDLILFNNHNVLNISKVVGGDGSDTLAFGENGISITDDKFGGAANINQVEALQTKDGTNYIQAGAQANLSGLATIIGGADKDTIDASAFTGASLVISSGGGDDLIYGSNSVNNSLDAGAGNDVIIISGSGAANNTISAGGGNDVITLKDSAAISRSTVDGGAGTDVLSLSTATTLNDSQLGGISNMEVLRAASLGDSQFILGATAQQIAGIRSVFGGGGNDTLDASGYTTGLTLNGGAGDDNLIVSTGDRLRSNKADGGSGNDTLSFSIDAASVTDADFVNVDNVEALKTANGNNRILLGANAQAAGIATLIGGAGNDTIDASATTRGFVFLDPSANDSLVGGSGVDTISVGSSFNMSLASGIEVLKLTGASPATLTGNSENNTIIGATGVDTLIGQDGNDAYIVNSTGDTIIDTLGNDAVYSSVSFDLSNTLVAGGTGIENLVYTGTVGATLTGNSANNSITGGAGNDTIDGGTGADSMIGGAGDDIYYVDNLGDTILEKAGEGTDIVFSAISQTLGANVENLTYTGSGSASLVGNSLANSIDGTAGTGVNTLQGGDGNDTLIVSADRIGTIDGGNGFDTVIFKGNNGITLDDSSFLGAAGIENYDFSQVIGNLNIALGSFSQGKGITSLGGSSYDDTLSAAAYSVGIRLDGLGGNDSLVGGFANDTLNGGSGSNTMRGGYGDDLFQETISAFAPSFLDTVTGGNGTDTLQLLSTASLSDALFQSIDTVEVLQLAGDSLSATGNKISFGSNALASGISTIVGSNANDTIDASGQTNPGGSLTVIGGNGNNAITGSTGNDSITAGAGRNTLSGGGGNDTLVVSSGYNNLQGGAGDDAFVFSSTGNLNSTTVSGGDGTDTLILTQSAVNLPGDAVFGNVSGVEQLQLGGGANFVQAGSFIKAAGIRTVIGGSGKNTLSAEQYDSLTSVTLDASSSDASSLTGGNGSDLLIGGSNNDTLNGGVGGDAMQGGDGNDVYYYNENSDIITEYAFRGRDTVFSSIDYVLGNYVESVVLTGDALNATGRDSNSQYNDTLIGNSRDNILDDGKKLTSYYYSFMQGGLGNDTYIVNQADDKIDESTDPVGVDVVEAYVSYTLPEAVEKITLVEGANSARTATGNDAANTLIGNSINNTLDGRGGADTMIGGLGDDLYVVDNSGDITTESLNQGTDTVQVLKTGNLLDATTGNVTFTLAEGNNIENIQYVGIGGNPAGNTGRAVLTGNELDNSILGGRGDDSLFGGSSGDDTLNGGAGNDYMAGGYGDDYYVVDSAQDMVVERANAGQDTVSSAVSYTLSGGVETLILSGAGPLDGTGSTDNNTLVGNDSNNRLDGKTGADSMVGGKGDDIYIVDSFGDQVIEKSGQGIDTVYSSVSFDLSTNGDFVENLILTGTGNIDATGNSTGSTTRGVLANLLIGNSGNNNITGGDGNDTLDGGAGDDNMAGGLGNDLYIVDSVGDAVTEAPDQGTDTVWTSANDYVLGDNVENLYLKGAGAFNGTGNALDNLIVGSTSPNILDGADGNDTLDGGSGADIMIGGTGDDVYLVDNQGDQVIEFPDEGIDTVRSSISIASLYSDVEVLVHTGSQSLSSNGNELDNTLVGNEGVDTFGGGAGDDVYILNNANIAGYNITNQTFATLSGDQASENSGEGLDWVLASDSFKIGDNIEGLQLTGLANSTAVGNSLDNTLIGNVGDNILDGGSGADTMVGGAGNDFYVVDNTGDTVLENMGGGADTVYSSVNFTLGDNVENLILTGSSALNGTGNILNNQITGNAGGNVLDGGVGTNGVDTLTGKGGADTFVLGDSTASYYATSQDLDFAVITDFSTSDGDKLVLSGQSSDYCIGSLGNQPAAQGWAAQGGYSGIFADLDHSGGLTAADDLIAVIKSNVADTARTNATFV